MGTFIVHGGKSLKGEITPQGAKNEALQVICAVLLTSDKVIIKNIPGISDVKNLIDLISSMGVKVTRESDSVTSFEAVNVNLDYLQTNEFRTQSSSLRGSIMIVGPLLARFGKAFIPKPGGDKIGRRRVDTHFIGFQKLGARFEFDTLDPFFKVEAPSLTGTYMHLNERERPI
jgi:UDP-N-acetylglucosamine 1-carboxyvinyltransferase